MDVTDLEVNQFCQVRVCNEHLVNVREDQTSNFSQVVQLTACLLLKPQKSHYHTGKMMNAEVTI